MNTQKPRTRRAFTMIELLVVIAIIAILAAILFPIFGTVREQARQSNTMSNLHAIYLGARLFYEDEGRYPPVLFGYAEVKDNSLNPPYRPARDGDTGITPMDQTKNFFNTNPTGNASKLNRGYLYREQVKDYQTFLNADNTVKNSQAITHVYWPQNSPIGQANGTRVWN